MSEDAGPVSALADKLSSAGIPSLSVLIAQISGAEDYAEFRQIVKEFLPEREQEIFRQSTPVEQIEAFASYFEDRYFPLDQSFRMGDIEGYEDITRQIPVIVQGLSWDDYHEISADYRPGCQLMTYLVANPWEGDADVALAEACQEHVPPALIERVTEHRLPPEEAHRILNGTKYDGLALWADYISCNTGNFFLDTDYEYLWNSIPPDWDRATVESLTTAWQQSEILYQTMMEFSDWLEVDLPGRFKEVIDFIMEKRGETKANTGA
jgi:hypothetical protein